MPSNQNNGTKLLFYEGNFNAVDNNNSAYSIESAQQRSSHPRQLFFWRGGDLIASSQMRTQDGW